MKRTCGRRRGVVVHGAYTPAGVKVNRRRGGKAGEAPQGGGRCFLRKVGGVDAFDSGAHVAGGLGFGGGSLLPFLFLFPVHPHASLFPPPLPLCFAFSCPWLARCPQYPSSPPPRPPQRPPHHPRLPPYHPRPALLQVSGENIPKTSSRGQTHLRLGGGGGAGGAFFLRRRTCSRIHIRNQMHLPPKAKRS